MKLALHRSITFWSGLLVMGFVCWAWWDSLQTNSVLSHEEYVAGNCGSGLTIALLQDGKGAGFHWIREPMVNNGWEELMEFRFTKSRFYRKTSPARAFSFNSETPDDPHFLLIFMPVWAYGRTGDWMLYLPHWLILVTLAAAWLPLLFWRARRRSKSAIIP